MKPDKKSNFEPLGERPIYQFTIGEYNKILE